jgi:hypothetical protein
MYHQPGWTLPNGHTVRSQMEASLCQHLLPSVFPHRHGLPETDSYNVTIAPQRHALYVPSILLNAPPPAPRLIVVEPLDTIRPGGGLRRLIGFRQAHRADLFLVVVARRALHPHIPPEAYDLLVPLDDFLSLDQYLATLA